MSKMPHEELTNRVRNLTVTVESMFDRGVITSDKAIQLGVRIGMLYGYERETIGILHAEENLRIHFRELMGIHEENRERREKEEMMLSGT